MMIPVIYLDGRHDFVKPRLLDDLISRVRIREFRRRDGWVHLRRDPVRCRTDSHPGPERRTAGTVAPISNERRDRTPTPPRIPAADESPALRLIGLILAATLAVWPALLILYRISGESG